MRAIELGVTQMAAGNARRRREGVPGRDRGEPEDGTRPPKRSRTPSRDQEITGGSPSTWRIARLRRESGGTSRVIVTLFTLAVAGAAFTGWRFARESTTASGSHRSDHG